VKHEHSYCRSWLGRGVALHGDKSSAKVAKDDLPVASGRLQVRRHIAWLDCIGLAGSLLGYPEWLPSSMPGAIISS
jgi:hypothetical protein